MKQFLKRFRIPLIVVGVLGLLSATALITHRAYAVKSAQDEGKSTQSPQTDGGAQTAQDSGFGRHSFPPHENGSGITAGDGETEYIPLEEVPRPVDSDREPECS